MFSFREILGSKCDVADDLVAWLVIGAPNEMNEMCVYFFPEICVNFLLPYYFYAILIFKTNVLIWSWVCIYQFLY